MSDLLLVLDGDGPLYEQIRKAIVVDVSHGDALAESIVTQAARLGDVGESAVAQIAVQSVKVFGLLRLRRPPAACSASRGARRRWCGCSPWPLPLLF